MKLLRNFFDKYRMYVMIDGEDNSITLSKAVIKKIDPWNLENPSVFVFATKDGFGFTTDYLPPDTTLAPIQYNQEHECIGFASTVVQQVLNRWHLPWDFKCTLSVTTGYDSQGNLYYKVVPPNGIRNQENSKG